MTTEEHRANDPTVAFERLGPPLARSPLVCAVPHAGRIYPASLLAASAVPRAVLETLEDRHADLLVAHAVADGAVAIVARPARAWIDLNRGEEDLDPALRPVPGDAASASARARSGLGLIPRRLGQRELWRTAPTARAAAERIAHIHRPYHTAIAEALAEARARHGHAVLLDCHSMPPLGGRSAARIVLGDRHGTSAGHGMLAEIAAAARAERLATACNAPYAGAYSLARHGRPDAGIHAVQLEIDRTLYLAPGLCVPGSGLEAMRRLVARLARAALASARRLSEPPLDIAAE